MLFVGFSFEDDNFHRIVHDVRNAMGGRGGPERRPFGTAVMLEDDGLRQALWKGELDFAITAGPVAADDDGLAAARRFEIFLDQVGAKTSTVSSYLLDPAFDELLSLTDRTLRDEFDGFLRSVASHPEATAWRDLLEFAERHGWKRTAADGESLRRRSARPHRGPRPR
jgi:hypothetical protein